MEDEVSTPDEGQGAVEQQAPSVEASASEAMGQPVEESAFFEATDEKGNPVKFKSKEELAEAWKKSGMLRSDYTRKTQSLAEERRKLEQWKAEQEKILEQRRQEMKKFDDFLKNRPDVYQKLKQAMQNPNHETAYLQAQEYTNQVSEEIRKELEDLKAWKAQREQEEQRTKIFQDMKSRYPDFDESKVQEMLAGIDPSNQTSLAEILYYASKGKESPAQIEQRIAQGQAQKQAGRLMPGSGSPSAARSGHRSFDDAEAAALKEL